MEAGKVVTGCAWAVVVFIGTVFITPRAQKKIGLKVTILFVVIAGAAACIIALDGMGWPKDWRALIPILIATGLTLWGVNRILPETPEAKLKRFERIFPGTGKKQNFIDDLAALKTEGARVRVRYVGDDLKPEATHLTADFALAGWGVTPALPCAWTAAWEDKRSITIICHSRPVGIGLVDAFLRSGVEDVGYLPQEPVDLDNPEELKSQRVRVYLVRRGFPTFVRPKPLWPQ